MEVIPIMKREDDGAIITQFDQPPCESLGLLIEEQRTNLFLYSEQFDNATYTKNDLTINANSNVAPNGTLTADSIIATTANTNHYISQTLSKSASIITYSYSVYVKATGSVGYKFLISIDDATIGGCEMGYFNFATGVTAPVLPT
jgi:hypothetical protein